MGLDIRVPIGGMFSILGLILVVFGLVTAGNTEMYARSLGLNMNIGWGAVMLAFGLIMLFFGRRASARDMADSNGAADAQQGPGSTHTHH
ncbi:MAG: hypothetical protein ABFD16_01105 [Thermoguttaceae bacterium]|jgi:membrane-bound ClpP family serine protease